MKKSEPYTWPQALSLSTVFLIGGGTLFWGAVLVPGWDKVVQVLGFLLLVSMLASILVLRSPHE